MKHNMRRLTLCKIILASIGIVYAIPMLASEYWVQKKVAHLSLDQKIGQLFMAAAISETKKSRPYTLKPDNPEDEINFFSFTTSLTSQKKNRHADGIQTLLDQSPYRMDREYIEHLITNYHIGGIIFMGMSTPKEQKETTQHFQQLSTIPLLIGQDLEWGLSMRLKNVVRFPRAMTLGALAPHHEQLIYDIGHEVGRQCKTLGVHINFAPVADVNNNPYNPVINTRSFGQDAESVARKSILFARGMQDAGIIACAKHFPGHGDTDVDSHHALPILMHDKKRLEKIELYPFQQLIKNNIQALMVAHLEIPELEPEPGLPASLSHSIITDLLRNTLGFNGLIVTDGLGMRGVTNQFKPGDIELRAVLAGHDILVAPTDIPRAHAAIKEAIKDGIFSEQELDTRVAKILHAKYTCGAITQAQQLIKKSDKKMNSALNSTYAQQLSERAYQATITLVKNTNTILPLKTSYVLQKNNGQALNTPLPLILIDEHENHDFIEKLSAYLLETNHEQTQRLQKTNIKQVLSVYNLALDATPQKIASLFNSLTQTTHTQTALSPTVIISSCQKRSVPTDSTTTNNKLQNSTATLINLLHTASIRTIVIAYETPYNLAEYRNADALICAYENTTHAHTAAINTLLGNHNPSGMLPVTASDFWPVGWGLHYSRQLYKL